MRVQQQFMAVETMPSTRIVRAVNPEGIELPLADSVDSYMPDVPCAMRVGIQLESSSRCRIIWVIEQIQPNAGGMTAEQREINASVTHVCAKWYRIPSIYLYFIDQIQFLILKQVY